MKLTEKIAAAIEAERGTPDGPTAAERAESRAFVDACRKANPYTVRFFNVTRQIRLAVVAPKVADELRVAAKYEGVNDVLANPGLAVDAGKVAD